MASGLDAGDIAKRAAARAALDEVQPGMRVGLGTGSTAEWFVDLLGRRARETRLDIACVATSERTARRAERAGLRLMTLDESGWLDLVVDGADEVDARLDLIKGGGGALLQEKIVATASDRMVVIADGSKRVATLGAFPLPVEIVPFGWETTKAVVEELLEDQDVDGRLAVLRLDRDAPFITDGGNMIVDLHLKRIGDAAALWSSLNLVAGVVESGLFVDIADRAILGHADERIEHLDAAR